jgi:hypothetical protein
MNRETILELPGLTLWYYPITKVIHHEVSKYPGVSVLESALQKGLEVMRRRGARKWLSDDRKGGALPKTHHEWGQNVWGPDAAAAGWKYWALLPPSELVGSANVHRLVSIYGALGVTVKTFDDPVFAMHWLVEQRA